MAGHPKAAGVVDDDEVDAPLLQEFGTDARARAGGDDRPASPQRGLEPREHLGPRVGVSFARPGIRHRPSSRGVSIHGGFSLGMAGQSVHDQRVAASILPVGRRAKPEAVALDCRVDRPLPG